MCSRIISKGAASRLNEVIIQLCSHAARLHLDCCVCVLALTTGKVLTYWKKSSGSPLEWPSGLEHMVHREKLRELYLFSLRERRLR